jgi:tRNA/tmRNA/rRNA uracil-C5-methylase (TrmA/RlmC/RlmD family)
VKIGDRIEVEIGGIAHGGHCVARYEGQVIFVRHAIPGEKVIVEITEMNSKFARGDAMEILQPSNDRVTAQCQYARPGGCGGCDFQHISLERQRKLKADVVREQFTRVAKMDVELSVEEVSPTSHWRTRMDFTVSENRKLALYSSRSHRLVEVDSCQIADESIPISEINQRKLPQGAKVHVAVGSNGKSVVEIEGRQSHELVVQEVGSQNFSLSPTTFWQSHRRAPEVLSSVVQELARAKSGDHVFDLYGGVGLFTGALIDVVGAGGRITLIESDELATTDARRKFAINENVEIISEKVERVLDRFTRADIVIADPPRAGLGARVCAMIDDLNPRAIVYVSCDPSSLARDARLLVDAGYEMDLIRAFDLFPMTHHIECVARFIKSA